MRSLVFALLFCAAVNLPGKEGPWKTERFGTFGPMVSMPSDLRPDPNNGQGESRHSFTFRTADGAFSVTVQNFIHVPYSARVPDTLLALLREDRTTYRGGITFQRRHGRGYTVVARQKDLKVFVQKFGRRPDSNGMALRGLEIEFPIARRAEFDPWMERIAASYRPFVEMDR